jgi:hypothetical protein
MTDILNIDERQYVDMIASALIYGTYTELAINTLNIQASLSYVDRCTSNMMRTIVNGKFVEGNIGLMDKEFQNIFNYYRTKRDAEKT